MLSQLKTALKIAAYKMSALSVYHTLRNSETLTVAMFHRVLPTNDPRYAGADPEWTVTPEIFRECILFFRRHYAILSPDTVFSALRGETTLPSRGLLITFDDGWADNAEYALPILNEFSISSLIFVVGNAVNQKVSFWEERIYSFLATQPDSVQKLKSSLASRRCSLTISVSDKLDESSIKKLINELKRLDRSLVQSLIHELMPADSLPAAMLDTEKLLLLRNAAQKIGSHGLTHQPLTEVRDVENELSGSKTILSNYLHSDEVDSISFPHGAYSESILEECKIAGYKYIFTSKSKLNANRSSLSNVSTIGRIHISQRQIKDSSGKFQPALLATWLFLRPILKQAQVVR